MLNQLPSGTQQPVLTLEEGQTVDAMYIGFNSTVLTPAQILQLSPQPSYIQYQ